MNDAALLAKQATIFSAYLVHDSPDDQAIKLFRRSATTVVPDASDEKLLRFILRHPKLVGYIDAGLALLKPHSEVRRRLYAMFAILEATPHHTQLFLGVERSWTYGFVVVGVGIRAVWRALIGVCIVKLVGRA